MFSSYIYYKLEDEFSLGNSPKKKKFIISRIFFIVVVYILNKTHA